MILVETVKFEKKFTPYIIESENSYILKSTIQTKFGQACRKGGIRKDVKVNLFKQSFTTHLLKNIIDQKIHQEYFRKYQ